MDETLSDMIEEEFGRFNYAASQAEIATLACALEVQDVDYGEVGVGAAVIGFLVAKGRNWKNL